jgi:gliding motility-associated-like protein
METPLESMTYYAAAIDPITGCESTTRTAFEIVVQPCNIKVYNALSVNGDGLNEKLIIENISYFPENELMIYNRNGRLVYKTSNYGTNNNFFTGRANINSTINNSKVLPMGTYFYSFTYKIPLDQQYITTNGFINLVTN